MKSHTKNLFRCFWNVCNFWGSSILINGIKRIKDLPQGVVLDVGCGKKPYKTYFSGKITSYVGLDHYIIDPHSNEFCGKAVDVVGDAVNLPILTGVIDTVLCFNALNVFTNPFVFFAEASRVLSVKGHLIVTTGFMYPIWSQLYDRWRATKYGLKLMAEDNGFIVKQIIPLGEGFWTTTAVSFTHYLHYMLSNGIKLCVEASTDSHGIPPKKKIISMITIIPFTPLLPILVNLFFVTAWILDKVILSDKHTVYYLLIAQKG